MDLSDNFSTLFELLPIGAYRTDARSRQVRATPAMVRIFGFESEAEMLASQKSRAEGWYLDPSRRALFRELLERDGMVRNFVSEMRRDAAAETFWISETAHLVRDAEGNVLYHEGTVEDISERVRAQQAKEEAQTALAGKSRSLQITLDSMSQGILALDAQERVVMWHRRFLQLLGFSETLLASRPTFQQLLVLQIARGDFGPDFDRVEHAARRYVSQNVNPARGPETYMRKSADGRTIEVRTQPLPDGGVVRTLTDMTAWAASQEA